MYLQFLKGRGDLEAQSDLRSNLQPDTFLFWQKSNQASFRDVTGSNRSRRLFGLEAYVF